MLLQWKIKVRRFVKENIIENFELILLKKGYELKGIIRSLINIIVLMLKRNANVSHEENKNTKKSTQDKIDKNVNIDVAKKVAIVVGHSSTSRGAKNITSNISEWEYNKKIAKIIFTLLRISGKVEPVIVYRENGYSELPREINKMKVDLVLSLHCNAFNGVTSGCEMLYYHKSKNSKMFAEITQKNMVIALGNKNRGIRSKTSEDRGGYLLKSTDATCIIAEPFFIDNNKELENALEKEAEISSAYVKSINEFFKKVK